MEINQKTITINMDKNDNEKKSERKKRESEIGKKQNNIDKKKQTKINQTIRKNSNLAKWFANKITTKATRFKNKYYKQTRVKSTTLREKRKKKRNKKEK